MICNECHGDGYIPIDVSDSGTGSVYDDCPSCNSQGEINEESMEACEAKEELGK
tara:strand:- start:64 stop:225 length:162 start_codon:yes stop_codon:yes gene_type:complete